MLVNLSLLTATMRCVTVDLQELNSLLTPLTILFVLI